jgi:hypothetical protein
MMRHSAMRSCVTVCSETGLPKATRLPVRTHIFSSVRSASPISHMQIDMAVHKRLEAFRLDDFVGLGIDHEDF